ncbi:MAG: hypothetical protein K6E29_01395 [Cyanobacteria bacterium RUI128]|nr:hypothetical protein [Cyanobacteria bacterium RUI128]
MNIMSRYAFISNFNAEKLSKQEANKEGVGAIEFSKCDTDGDGNISIDEILANQDICEKLLQAIQNKIDKISGEEAGVKAEQAKAANEEKFEVAA